MKKNIAYGITYSIVCGIGIIGINLGPFSDITGFLLTAFLWLLTLVSGICAIVLFIGALKTKTEKTEDEVEVRTNQNYSYGDTTPKQKRYDVVVQTRIDNLYLVYQYGKVKFIPNSAAEALALDMQRKNSWELIIKLSGEDLNLYWESREIGKLIDRVDMVKDWINRGDLLKVWLENIGSSGNFVRLAFYRDEMKRLADKESSVVKLTRCYNEDAQFSMSGLKDGEKLDFDDNYESDDPDGTIWITYGSAIGTLPKRTAQRYLNEGAAAVFLDHLDYDIEKDKEIPYVKIYW